MHFAYSLTSRRWAFLLFFTCAAFFVSGVRIWLLFLSVGMETSFKTPPEVFRRLSLFISPIQVLRLIVK
jgi:hypothetical protein